MDRRGEVVWGDFVHEERLVEDRAYWQWGDVRGRGAREGGPFRCAEEGMDSRPRLHGGRLFAGSDGCGALGLRGGRFSNRPYGREGYA